MQRCSDRAAIGTECPYHLCERAPEATELSLPPVRELSAVSEVKKPNRCAALAHEGVKDVV